MWDHKDRCGRFGCGVVGTSESLRGSLDKGPDEDSAIESGAIAVLHEHAR